jgi:aminopeptidase N
MLRVQMGDEAFFKGLQHYLEVNRFKNVVTADLVKALEESSGMNLDKFFDEWVYGAGEPQFEIDSNYDADAKQLHLTVDQTQKVAGHVGLFTVPIEVSITTTSGTKSFPITVSKQDETFSFPADAKPLMVLFDIGDKILKTVEFHKTTVQWIYQLQNAPDVPDRTDAAQALAGIKGDDAIAALGDVASNDRFWGVRNESLLALGRIGGKEAEQRVLAAMSNTDPRVRETAASQLGRFHDDALASKLAEFYRSDPAYRVRSAALIAYGQQKPSDGLAFLQQAAQTESPDDVIRRAALRAMGSLGDGKAAQTLVEWSSQGKPIDVRDAAIASLAQVDKKNEAIESELIDYVNDPDHDVQIAALLALGARGDSAAIAPLEAMLKRDDVDEDLSRFIQRALARLRGDSATVTGG